MVGAANKVLLHFYESNDLMCFDLSTKQLTMSLAVSQETALALEGLQSITVGSLVGGGYVYLYRADPDASRDGCIVMIDLDADGVMDSSQYYTYEQRGAAMDSIDWEQDLNF